MGETPVSTGSVRFRDSLRFRVLVIIGVSLVLLAIPFGWYAWTQTTEQAADIRNQQQRRGMLRTEIAAGIVRQAQATLIPLSLDPELRHGEWKQAEALLKHVGDASAGCNWIGVADTRGRIRAQHGAVASPASDPNVAGQAWFALAKAGRGFAVGEHQRSGPGDTPTIIFSHAVLDDKDRVIGVVGYSVPVSVMRERLLQVGLAYATSLSVLDDHGCVIIQEPDGEGIQGKTLPRDDIETWLYSNRAGQQVGRDFSGRRALLTHAPVYVGQGQGLYLVTSADLAKAMGPARSRTATVVATYVVFAAVLAGVAMFGSSRWVLQPIDRLVNHAHTLEAGGLRVPARLPQGAAGECVQLKDAFNSMAHALDAKIEELEEAREAERHIADQLQQGLIALPSYLPNLQIASAYRSATEFARVGGDFYDLFEFEDGRTGIVIGDVSGKGLDAAAFTSLVKNTLRVLAAEGLRTPAEVMERANRIIVRQTASEWFMTVFFGILDPAEDLLVYCNAGHATGFLRRPGDILDDLPSTSPIVAAYPDLTFTDAETAFRVYDTLVLYTDGLTEARRGSTFYGEKRLGNLLHGMANCSAEEIRDAILASVLKFSGSKLRDDLAILVIRRTPS